MEKSLYIPCTKTSILLKKEQWQWCFRHWLNFLFTVSVNKMYKYNVFSSSCLTNWNVPYISAVKFTYQGKINWYSWQKILMLLICLLRYLRLQEKCLIPFVTIRKVVISYTTRSFIWTIMKIKNSIKEKAINRTTCFLIDIISELLLLHY